MLGVVARKYAHKIPFIVKINHNELLTYPNKFQQILFGTSSRPGRWARRRSGATIYFGSDDADREIVEIAEAFHHAHELGMATVLWAYLRNNAFKKDGVDYHTVGRPDRPGQPPGGDHPGRHRQAEAADEQRRLQGAELRQDRAPRSTSELELVTDHPIDWNRWQVVNCYMGRAGLINSGGESKGADDFAAGGAHGGRSTSAPAASGLISGRKAFQRPMKEGVELLHDHPGRLPLPRGDGGVGFPIPWERRRPAGLLT